MKTETMMLKKEKQMKTLVLFFIAGILFCSAYSKLFADMIGAQVGDTIVIFSSTETVMEKGEFSINASSDIYRMIISDLHPDTKYDVIIYGVSTNEEVTTLTSKTSAAGLLYFPPSSGLQLPGGRTYLVFIGTNLVSIGTVGRLLYPGWNLISIPFRLSNDNIDTALDGIAGNYSSVWAWACDLTHPNGGYWELYDPDSPLISDLETLDPDRGYWVNMTDFDILSLNDGGTSDEPISLEPGWNLVGYKSLTAEPVEDALSSIAGHFNSVWTWICDPTYASGGYWMLYDPEKPLISDLETLEPWMGLWIDVIDECTWDVNASGP